MNNNYQGMKVRVTIVACDPTQRLIHGRFKDGGVTSIAVFEIPQAFRWPQVGEVWTVSKQNNYWILGSRLNNDQYEPFPVTTLSTDPDLRLDGTTIYDLNGNQGIFVPMSGVQNNYQPFYSTTTSGWTVGPAQTVGAIVSVPRFYGIAYQPNPTQSVFVTGTVTLHNNGSSEVSANYLTAGQSAASVLSPFQGAVFPGWSQLINGGTTFISNVFSMYAMIPPGWWYAFINIADPDGGNILQGVTEAIF